MKPPNMKYPVAIFVPLLFLFSCATILNRGVQKIAISTDPDVKVISIDKATLADPSLPATDSIKEYYVNRSRQLLQVDLQIDSRRKSIFLKPKNSVAFWLNFCTYGIGMLVDIQNPKRFAYSKHYHLAAEDTSNKKYRFVLIPIRKKRIDIPIKKGTLNFTISQPPCPVIFDIKALDQHYTSTGIAGIGGGLEYFYSDRHYLSINAGAGTDEIPIPMEHFGPGHSSSGSIIFANIRNNNVYGRFNWGYGISLSKYNWSEVFYNTSQMNHSLSNIALGASFSAQYRVRKQFNLGILYQPGLLNLSYKPTFEYQHYISFNVIWKFPLLKIAR